jgi:hypothetical protein
MAERHTHGADRYQKVAIGLRRTAIAGLRNGMPDALPYRWNQAGQEREREVAARLAVLRGRLAARAEAGGQP